MKKLYTLFISALLLLSTLSSAIASDNSLAEKKVPRADREAITLSFYKIRPDIKIQSITATPVSGVYQVKLEQGVLYSLQGGEFFIAGDLYQMAETGMINVTEEGRIAERKSLLAQIKEEDKIVFAAKNEQVVIHIFTDVDCGYCRKLHSEMEDYNSRGITIKYLAFPREGTGSNTYRKMVTAWCADDKAQVLTQFKSGSSLPFVGCTNNPVTQQYELGLSMGVNGTPAIVLSSGEMLAGYLPPAQLAQALGLKP